MLKRHRKTLELYASVLPKNEYEALRAWLTTFWPFQINWLLETARKAIVNKSRQIGYSHTTAAVAVLWAVFHGETTTIISKGQNESTEVLEKVAAHRDILVALGSKLAQPTRNNATEIRVISGGRVIALPSSGGRSFTGNVILDEFAYHQHPDKVWDAAIPVASRGNFRVRIISTPNGVGNLFHQVFTDPEAGKGWAKHEVTIDQAVADGMEVNWDDLWSDAHGDKRLFDQMYKCSFLDGQLQYIASGYVESAREKERPETSGHAFGGLDIGRTNDRTELYVMQSGEDGRDHVVYKDSCKRTSSDDIKRIVRQAFQSYDLRGLAVDASGLGTFPAEDLQTVHGVDRVLAVDFTPKVKEELATGLYHVFTNDLIRIPHADAVLSRDICSIQRIITTAGNIQYASPRNSQGHGDSAWALALAVYAKSQMPVFDYGPAPSALGLF